VTQLEVEAAIFFDRKKSLYFKLNLGQNKDGIFLR
jgi:hypothetical protein